jgi:hypothetical protein
VVWTNSAITFINMIYIFSVPLLIHLLAFSKAIVQSNGIIVSVLTLVHVVGVSSNSHSATNIKPDTIAYNGYS